MNRIISFILSLIACLYVVGCGTTKPAPKLGEPLRVAVTPNYPPLIFKQGDEVVGLEADLARQLGTDLLRPVEFVEVEPDDLIPALQAGRADIIMSGLSITRDRMNEVAFSRPYLDTGIAVLRRKKDARTFDSQEAVAQNIALAGIQKDTSAEGLVKEQFPDAGVKKYDDPREAALDLQRSKIGLFLNGGPTVAWLASENSKELSPMETLLIREQLAWAVSKDHDDLLTQVNARLRTWKDKGTLARTLTRWIPNYKQLKKLLSVPAE